MKKNLTELVFILDRSGSMSGLESDTIGGFNAMIEKQRKVQGEAIITTVLFDDQYELLHDRINVRGVKAINESEYFVRGSTALLDAIGMTIKKISNAQKNTTKDEKAGNIIFVITTDGMENASCEYTYEKIKSMIEDQKEKHEWEFIFLGENIDAISTASKFGIKAERVANYNADSKGTQLNYMVINEAISEYRTNKSLPNNWKHKIDEDYEKRS